MTDPSRAARTIAAGGNPTWTETFTHRQHGDLTFTARLPLAKDSLRHSIEMDNQLQDLAGAPSIQTQILVAAIAGMTVPDDGEPGHGLLVQLPVIGEDHVADDERGSTRIVRRYYDAASEPDVGFLSDVWLAYSTWRNELLSDATVSAVGESSAAESTSSAASSTQ